MEFFINDDFLLNNKTAQRLYHDIAAKLPIIDYHNHLFSKDVAENVQFKNITQLWLTGDHYKWRAMRTNGIEEKYITGNASDKEKFIKWAATVPYTLRNPLYHWTHLELARYFEVKELLSENNAESIYNKINEMLVTPEFSSQSLLKKMNVEVICTTDDPTDSLEHHRYMSLSKENSVQMYPTFRPDAIFRFDEPKTIKKWIQRLALSADVEIKNYSSFLKALQKRVTYFHENGCRLSDHDVQSLEVKKYQKDKMKKIFQRILTGKIIAEEDRSRFFSGLLLDLAQMYKKADWTMQLHVGALRNNNSIMKSKLGKDSGFDSINDASFMQELSRLLDAMNDRDGLPKTILYNLNPSLNEAFATMPGNFQSSEIPGKIQYGPAWWFNDQKRGIINQLNALSEMGLLARFTGMVTDSRSLLSFPRHEYFRRILCNIIGEEVERGEIPNDESLLNMIITNVCYDNAKKNFGFSLYA